MNAEFRRQKTEEYFEQKIAKEANKKEKKCELMVTALNKRTCGLIIGITGGLGGVFVAFHGMPSFLVRPSFYGPLLGILGGILGVIIAVKNETDPDKKRRLTVMGVVILGICLLFWIGIELFVSLK